MADGFRFIHAADIHLDSPLRGLSRYEGIPEDVVRAAPREAFRNLIDRALQEKVDFVIFAGDVLDGDIRDINTGIFMVRQFARLERAGIPVYMLKGNHDAASELSQTIQWPSNVHEFSHRKAESFSLPKLRVKLHGQSFKQPEVLDDLAAHYPAPEPGYFNIGVLHTGLEGKTKHKGYAPCNVSELQARGYDYWALGHIHEFSILSETPHIVYPGNLQGRDIGEIGPKGAVLVEVNGADVQVDRLLVDVMRWRRVEVDVTGRKGLRECVDLAARALSEAFDQHAAGLPMAARVRLVGSSAAHGEIAAKVSELRTEILLRAAQVSDGLWIEKIERDTQPEERKASGTAGADAFADLLRYIRDASSSPDMRIQVMESLEAELARFESEAVESSDLLKALRNNNPDDLLRRATDDAVGRLLSLGGQP